MKRIIFLAIIVVLVAVAVNIALSIVSLWSKRDLLLSTQNRLVSEQKENKKLKSDLVVVNSQEFIEEEARNKLFMGKTGEMIVFFPVATPSASKVEFTQKGPNWFAWWSLFF